MTTTTVLVLSLLTFFLIFSAILVYLFLNMRKISSKVESVTTSSKSSDSSNTLENILERINLLELKKNNERPAQVVKYLPADPPIPGEPGRPGPPGPRGRTLIQDINQLFDGRDEIEVFKRLQDSIPADFRELETVCSSFSQDEDKNKAIFQIKSTLEKNAKNLYGISKLRKIKQETNELCQEVIKSYKKYVESFEKLHNAREGSADDKIQEAIACKVDLKDFQYKIDKFNENLSIITEKKREFFLGDKAELEPGEETVTLDSEEAAAVIS